MNKPKTAKKQTSKIGRPTKYSPELCEKILPMFKNGESIVEVCAQLGISRDTFYDWIKIHDDFSDTIKRGLELSEAWWSRLGRNGAAGKAKIQPATWIFNMKNRFKWTDKVEVNETDDFSAPAFYEGELADDDT